MGTMGTPDTTGTEDTHGHSWAPGPGINADKVPFMRVLNDEATLFVVAWESTLPRSKHVLHYVPQWLLHSQDQFGVASHTRARMPLVLLSAAVALPGRGGPWSCLHHGAEPPWKQCRRTLESVPVHIFD